jgi:hypothetical protein
MSYDTARAEVIKAGWQPALNLKQDVNDLYAQDFRKANGFSEVESCSGSGLLRCAFIFTDSSSPARIRLVTAGEGMPTVEAVQVQRPKPAQAAQSVQSPPAVPAAKKPPTDVIGNYFAKLPDNSRKMAQLMQDSYAKYIYFILKNESDDPEYQVSRFCYEQAVGIDQIREGIQMVMATSGQAVANDQVRQFNQLDALEQQDLFAKGSIKQALLIDVKVSTRMFAGYGMLSGDRLTRVVASACGNAKDLAKSEMTKPESVLAYHPG